MKDIIAWIQANYKLVIYCFCTLVIFLCTVCRKSTKVQDSVPGAILKMLPELIKKVEEPGNGKSKKQAVIEMCLAAVSKLFPGVNANQYLSFIRESIEAILETPQKRKVR